MSNLITEFMGKLPVAIDWHKLCQYVAISLSPLLLIATIFIWQNMGDFNSDNRVLSVTSSNPDTALSESSSPSATQSKSEIFIDISGAVNQPGIKRLSVDARVNDAIWSAEGYTNQADKEYLAQVLNLAQPLKDGDKIYIPTYLEVSLSLPKPPTLLNKVNQPVKVLSQAESGDKSSSSVQLNPSEATALVNINTASQEQLESLPGIGEVNAGNIISGRPYATTNELCSKKIITSSATCEKIQDLITVE